jgi:hypothetical protein
MSGWTADHTDWVTFFIISTFAAIPGLVMLLGMIKRLPMAVQTGHQQFPSLEKPEIRKDEP